mmetsp:Transcript_61787/g.97555  ORF Transcript_61787/g.97555 Transcript_61787/m.97555 type:complete len:140 (+) Transcript_61787:233-652(+)
MLRREQGWKHIVLRKTESPAKFRRTNGQEKNDHILYRPQKIAPIADHSEIMDRKNVEDMYQFRRGHESIFEGGSAEFARRSVVGERFLELADLPASFAQSVADSPHAKNNCNNVVFRLTASQLHYPRNKLADVNAPTSI